MRAAVVCLLVLTACSGYDDLALLDIERVTPREIESDTTLRIHGAGFPLGREPVIALRGRLYRPGYSASTVDVQLVGTVRSESLIEVPVEAALIEALGGRATIDGEARVGFPAADGLREVFAVGRARIDVLPDTATQLRAGSIVEEQGDPSGARAFGLRLSREELGAPGVRVASVDPGGLAAIQGVKPGDKVVGLDGMRIYGWRDFTPDPTKTESTVLLSRDGLRGVYALRWPHEATEPLGDPLAMVALVLVGLFVGWCSPAALCLRSRHAQVPFSLWLMRGMLVLVFAALMRFVPSLQWITMWIVVLGTFAALFALATKGRAAAPSFALLLGAALAIMVLGATADVSEIIAAQRPGVTRWYLFQSPVSFLSFGAFVHGLGVIAIRSRLSASLFAAPAAVLGAVLFLGGWPLSEPEIELGVLAVKAIAILWAAQAFEMRPAVAAILCGSGLALASLGSAVDFDALLAPWSALAVGVVCALCARALVPSARTASAPVPA